MNPPPGRRGRTLGVSGGQDAVSRGLFAWFVRNPVASNILVVLVMVGGFLTLRSIRQEVFPEVELDLIVVNVPYPGASPEEVEKGVTLVAEEAVHGIDGVKKVTSTSSEGAAALSIELEVGSDTAEVLNQVRAAMDRITTFPADAEKPVVFAATTRSQVISVVLYGDASEAVLKQVAERVRDDLLADEHISMAELYGVRQPEISIEIPQSTLRQYRIGLEQVASVVRATSVEVPAGRIKTGAGDVLLRTAERRDTAAELAAIPVVASADGTRVTLGEIARIEDGFADTDQRTLFNGKPAAVVNVYRVGDEKPLEVAAAARDYVERARSGLPPGLAIATWFDSSEFYAGRMHLLVNDALQGLVLVIIVLGLFLEVRLAFWVTLGIPVSFLGSALFLPVADVSINMLSLFAFILALGMVVDDAINIGEAVHRYRQEGKSRVEAAILGVKEVAAPVTFAIVTIMIAYAPMLFVPGASGKFFRQIPVVVIGVLAISLLESLFILPAHLAHSRESRGRALRWIDRQQQRVAGALERFIDLVYVPFVIRATRRRYLALAVSLAILMSTCGMVAGGRIKFTFMPRIESDAVIFEAHLPFGAPAARTRALAEELSRTARSILEEHGGEAAISRGIMALVGSAQKIGGHMAASFATGGHIAQVTVYMVPIDRRSISAEQFARLWREKMAGYPGIDTAQVSFETGFNVGRPVDIELSHPDIDTLEAAARRLAAEMSGYAGVRDVDDGFTAGKPQLDVRLRPEGRAAGLTAAELARAVRSAFFGAEALRVQRGRDEVRAYVRLPAAERNSEHSFEQLIVRTPGGAEMPLGAVAEVVRGRSYTEIRRIDGRRAVAVTADVDEREGNANEVMARLAREVMPRLVDEFPRLTWSTGGEQREQADVLSGLVVGMGAAILVMYALLAMAFRSYVQPVVVLLAIPFGLVGAVLGHLLMGFSLSLMSLMGIVALAGVAINDSLVYVDAINRRRAQGASPWRAAVDAGAVRARPIILTASTSFIGLAPLITETSLQARFLVPMAISLGFGIVLSTAVTLVIVPCFYLGIEDLKQGGGRVWRWLWGRDVEWPR